MNTLAETVGTRWSGGSQRTLQEAANAASLKIRGPSGGPAKGAGFVDLCVGVPVASRARCRGRREWLRLVGSGREGHDVHKRSDPDANVRCADATRRSERTSGPSRRPYADGGDRRLRGSRLVDLVAEARAS